MFRIAFKCSTFYHHTLGLAAYCVQTLHRIIVSRRFWCQHKIRNNSNFLVALLDTSIMTVHVSHALFWTIPFMQIPTALPYSWRDSCKRLGGTTQNCHYSGYVLQSRECWHP